MIQHTSRYTDITPLLVTPSKETPSFSFGTQYTSLSLPAGKAGEHQTTHMQDRVPWLCASHAPCTSAAPVLPPLHSYVTPSYPTLIKSTRLGLIHHHPCIRATEQAQQVPCAHTSQHLQQGKAVQRHELHGRSGMICTHQHMEDLSACTLERIMQT